MKTGAEVLTVLLAILLMAVIPVTSDDCCSVTSCCAVQPCCCHVSIPLDSPAAPVTTTLLPAPFHTASSAILATTATGPFLLLNPIARDTPRTSAGPLDLSLYVLTHSFLI